VTLLSLKPENVRTDGAVKAEFTDAPPLLLAADYLPQVLLEVAGRELSVGEQAAFEFAAACYTAERIALRLIARAEQNSAGLSCKLKRRRIDAAVIQAVVSRLLEQNLLDDGRYAELWIRSRLAIKKTPTPQWLLAALAKRGIDKKASLKALNKMLDEETEYTLLLKYLERGRFPGEKKEFFLRGHLKYEGFSPAILDRYFEEVGA
jgi:regulatory protein